MSTEIKEAILQKVISTAWLNPHVDRQYTFKPARISRPTGVKRLLKLEFIDYPLPDYTNLYVVYELGQLMPQLYGFDSGPLNGWQRVDQLAMKEKMVFNGLINHHQIPTCTIYVMRTELNSTLIAVQYEPSAKLISSEYPFVIRVYNNAWFGTAAGNATEGVKYKSMKINGFPDIAEFRAFVTEKSALPIGFVQTFLNGVYRGDLRDSEIKVGDYVECIYDASGITFYDVPKSEMKSFRSELDNMFKFIIMAPELGRSAQVDFFDDCDFYICDTKKDENGINSTFGVHCNRTTASDIRMVTRNDYSMDSDKYSKVVFQQGAMIDYNRSFMRVFLRNSYIDKVPPKDGNHLDDLYLLDAEDRSLLLRGGNALVPIWHASNLERCAYIRWMGRSRHEINYPNIRKVLSWEGMFDVTQALVKVSPTEIALPIMMKKGGAVYMFKEDGRLSNVYTLSLAQQQQPKFTVLETETHGFFVPGRQAYLSQDLDLPSPMGLDSPSGYAEARYLRIGTGPWFNAVAGADFTLNANGSVTWLPIHNNSQRVKRSMGIFYNRSFTIAPKDLCRVYTVYPDGAKPPSGIPFGRLDIWLNGYKLIRDLDFYYDGFEFRIYNREYYSTTDEVLNIHILLRGLHNADAREVHKVGFVQHRMINYDGTFDLAPFRNKEISIQGMCPQRAEVVYSELRDGRVLPDKFREGAPYSVSAVLGSAPVDSLDGLVITREEEMEQERAISDYLTLRFPEPVIDEPIIVARRHYVISILMHTLIEEILNGTISVNFVEMSTIAVDFALRPYRRLLEIDICRREPAVDIRFVGVVCTGRNERISVTPNQYAFLDLVNINYLNSRCQLNDHLVIT